MPEVLLGTPRPIRSDDWVVGLPQLLAQVAHEPAFPRGNTNIGDGQDMLLMEMPIAHAVTLFRPASWGFFLGAGTGISWMWWFQVLGLFAACFLAFLAISDGQTPGRHTGLAAAGALLVTASPFMAFWSYGPARVAAYTSVCIAAWAALWRARSVASALAWGALLGWAAACFALVLYPPFQIPLAWVAVAAAGGLLLERRAELARAGAWKPPLVGLGLAVTIALVALISFWLAAEPSIERLLGTEYPGRRSFSGGGVPPWRLFGNDLGLPALVKDWSAWLNISEGGGFWLLFPVAALGLRRGRRSDPVVAALLGCIALLSLHALLGLPSWLATPTLLSQVQAERAVIGIGFADALLIVRVFSRSEPLLSDPWRAAAVAAVWGGGLLACVSPLQRVFPELPTLALVAAAGLNAAAAWALLRGLRPALVLGAVAALLASATFGFNPLVRGGADYLQENPLSRRILEIDREAGGDTVWLTYGSPFVSNLFRTLGVRSLNGLLAMPQREMWRRVDPGDRYQRFTNRYGHFTAVASEGQDARFRMSGPATIELVASPGSDAVRRLGATHVLIVAPDPSGPDAIAGIERIASVGRNHLYRLLPTELQPERAP